MSQVLTTPKRPADISDAEQVFSLAQECATSFVPAKPAFTAAFSRLLDNDSALLPVAEESPALVGYLLGFDHDTLFANGGISWGEDVIVHEDYRRQAIGKSLMNQFEAWARSRESRLVALATRRAAPFYLALGDEESATYFRKLL